MRRLVYSLIAVVTLFTTNVVAAPTPLLRTVARGFTMAEGDVTTIKLQCPAGYMPTGFSLTLGRNFDQYEQISGDLVDKSGAALNRENLTSASQLDGGGYAVTLFNDSHHTHNMAAVASCLSFAVSVDSTLVLAKNAVEIRSGVVGAVTTFCPTTTPVAVAGFSNASGLGLQDQSSAPVWGTIANTTVLADATDGQTGAPAGWQMKVFNGNIPATTVVTYAVCANAPTLQSFIYSVPMAFGNFDAVFAPVADNWAAVGFGNDGGITIAADYWLSDGTITNNLLWFKPSVYDSGTAEVRGFLTRGLNPPQKSAGAFLQKDAAQRAILVALAVSKPAAAPPPSTVSVVEFYNASLDHYFITAIPDEIAKLDDGTFVGWARTGQGFKAYGIGSSGNTGRRPVCRAYGLPTAGLNTHFYSASPDECFTTLQNLYGAWALEASEVFEMDLPNSTSGACPPGDVPVYRVWNQRVDSNHRYTTNPAIRDQMVAKGGVAEGYGPNAVALCALP